MKTLKRERVILKSNNNKNLLDNIVSNRKIYNYDVNYNTRQRRINGIIHLSENNSSTNANPVACFIVTVSGDYGNNTHYQNNSVLSLDKQKISSNLPTMFDGVNTHFIIASYCYRPNIEYKE